MRGIRARTRGKKKRTMKKEEREKIDAYLHGIVDRLPDSPGCYQYLDEWGTVIYVGKAKHLKRRVSSYFHRPSQSRKTEHLVPKIRDIKYVVVGTEEDALLLENKLIKRYQPHYNVLLKDDKTYPSIAVTKEYLPRIFSVRRRDVKGAEYYGPYSHLPTMHALLDLCRTLYKPRPCKTLMSREGVEEGRYEVCLDYHIGKCDAPCVGKIGQEEYRRNIEACRQILKGNSGEALRLLKEEMMRLAAAWKFEEAEEVKQKYIAIKDYRQRSVVVSGVEYNLDVYSIEMDERLAFVNYLHVVEGAVTQAFTFEYKKKWDETAAELLAMGIVEMRARYGSEMKEMVLPFEVDLPAGYGVQTVPKQGGKRDLLRLSELNVKQYRFDRLKQAERLDPEQRAQRLMEEIRKDLNLPRLPQRIELFDNSNISGEDAVAACVVFDQLKAAKKEYRTYHIKTVVGADDYASMHEVVLRRYRRLRDEGGVLPDLIIADGGAGQMEMIRRAVEDDLGLSIPIAGLAKDDKHRTHDLLVGFPPQKVSCSVSSELFRLLTRMQDEVHRFAISFHRKKRSKRQTRSELDGIRGIGAKTKSALLSELGSVRRIKESNLQVLQQCVGASKGRTVYEYFHPDAPSLEV